MHIPDDEAWVGDSPDIGSRGHVLFCRLSARAIYSFTHSLTYLLDCYEHGIEAMWASFAAVVLSTVFPFGLFKGGFVPN